SCRGRPRRHAGRRAARRPWLSPGYGRGRTRCRTCDLVVDAFGGAADLGPGARGGTVRNEESEQPALDPGRDARAGSGGAVGKQANVERFTEEALVVIEGSDGDRWRSRRRDHELVLQRL